MIPTSDLERDCDLIIELPRLEHGMALFRKIKNRICVIDEKPLLVNTEEIKSDIRYNLGYKDALKWVLEQPKEAQDLKISLE